MLLFKNISSKIRMLMGIVMLMYSIEERIRAKIKVKVIIKTNKRKKIL